MSSCGLTKADDCPCIPLSKSEVSGLSPRPCNRCSLWLVEWATRCVRSLTVLGPPAKRQTPKGCRDRITGRRLDRDVTTRRSSASAVVRWDTHKPGAPNRIIHAPSDRMGGIRNPPAHDSALMDHNRETTYRPGTHPYRSARDSCGPQIIFIVHINKFFGIVSLTHRWSLCHRKFCPVHGSGCNNIDRRLLRLYY